MTLGKLACAKHAVEKIVETIRNDVVSAQAEVINV